ncbi:myeloid leukemia factor 1-like isoform X1 [Montipora capricornis]|uniref:myeloid leukemia factor 1-like isoform X1 n=1 Tax=Montipora capricornis TaxID=246305 RepID=UPI0035F12F8A
MFRSALRDFEEDPFFRDHHNGMSSMFRGFGDPFPNFGFQARHPPIEHERRADRSHRQNNRQLAPQDMFGSMFGDVFANMNSMMANMHQNFESMANNPNMYSYSSSSVMSYSSDGQGQPKYFQATKSTKRAPGGVRETQHSLRDSESGLHRMAIGHHLGERSHVIERSVNSKSGDEERKQDFINLDESDAADFDREWKERTRQSMHGIKDRQRTNVRALTGTDPALRSTVAAPRRDKIRNTMDWREKSSEQEQREHEHRVARDRDWANDESDDGQRNHRNKAKRDKHVRLNSRPVNKHEPRKGGL